MNTQRLALLILAAGNSSRFEKGNKLLAQMGNVPIITKTCQLFAPFHFSQKIVVIPSTSQQLNEQIPSGFSSVTNEFSHLGIASSIKIGVESLKNSPDGFIIHLADLPFVKHATVETLIAGFYCEGHSKIVRPVHNNKIGHPVLFPFSFRKQLMHLEGDVGAKYIFKKNPELVRNIVVNDAGIHTDIDTMADISRIAENSNHG